MTGVERMIVSTEGGTTPVIVWLAETERNANASAISDVMTPIATTDLTKTEIGTATTGGLGMATATVTGNVIVMATAIAHTGEIPRRMSCLPSAARWVTTALDRPLPALIAPVPTLPIPTEV